MSDEQERFWAKTLLEPTSGCRIWTAGAIRNGYGAFYRTGGQQVLAHRYAYESVRGSIPDGMKCCHRCDARLCVNPDHLFIGTQGDNVRDARDKGRLHRQLHPQTHCKRGHALEGDNLSRHDVARRRCRICTNRRHRLAAHARRGGGSV